MFESGNQADQDIPKVKTYNKIVGKETKRN